MADVKFSALPAGSAPVSADKVIAVQSGVVKTVTAGQLLTLITTPVAAVSATVTTASTNDYSPTGFGATTARLRINPSANDITFTGLIAGIDGQQVMIFNTGTTYTIKLLIGSASSAAANRFIGAGTEFDLMPGQRTLAIYDGSSALWSIG